MRSVVEKPESQQLWGMEELEKQETMCGWVSLDKLGWVDLGGFYSGYSVSLSGRRA
jgi:hypothetical protein